jgi:isoleucyl-tRNA synthetase
LPWESVSYDTYQRPAKLIKFYSVELSNIEYRSRHSREILKTSIQHTQLQELQMVSELQGWLNLLTRLIHPLLALVSQQIHSEAPEKSDLI